MNLKKEVNMSQCEKFELINSEVRSFYEYCKEAGMTDEEINLICRPLTDVVRKAFIKKWTKVFLFVVMVLALSFTVSKTESVQWHAAAAVRILLIKLLPLWDWTPLYNNRCLVERSQPTNIDTNFDPPSNCISCEAIRKVAKIAETSYEEVFNHHLRRGAPVIVTDAHRAWSLDLNLTHLIDSNDRLRDSVPCRTLTNLRIGRQPMDLEEIVTRITNSDIPNWFVHFQNCDLKAVKSFRVLAPRPYFLPPHIPPSLFNWLLISHNYEARKFKYLDMDVGLIIMSQLRGRNLVSLRPRTPCEEECSVLTFDLMEGETLVMSNTLWEFEYLPGKTGENLAMITETDWIES